MAVLFESWKRVSALNQWHNITRVLNSDFLKYALLTVVLTSYCLQLRGRDIIFYWRTLAAKEKVTLRVEANAAVPGEYVGPASRAYLYYTDELKTWADPLKSSITPK